MIFFGWIKFTLSISAGRWSSSTCASHMFCSLKNGWLSFGLCLVMTSHGWPFSRPSDEQRIPTKWGVVPTNQWNRNKISRQISSKDFQVNQWIRSWIYPAPFICFNYPTHQLLRFIQFLPFFTHQQKDRPGVEAKLILLSQGGVAASRFASALASRFPGLTTRPRPWHVTMGEPQQVAPRRRALPVEQPGRKLAQEPETWTSKNGRNFIYQQVSGYWAEICFFRLIFGGAGRVSP